MQPSMLSLVLDGMMALLLLATLIYCYKLNKRILILQDSKSELARIIREFDESTNRATQNISDLHAATTRISDNIQLKIDKASYLANDLEMMLVRGNKLMGKTDTVSAPSQATPEPLPRTIAELMPPRPWASDAPSADASAQSPASGRARSRAEQELIRLIGGKKKQDSNR